MKVMHIEAHKNVQLDQSRLRELEKTLPSTIYIAYSIQYKELAEQVKNNLKSRKITGFSQVLGCSNIKTDSDILYIGTGRFHALNLATSTGREVYIFPELTRITKPEIDQYKAREKGKLSKFLLSDKAGILVTTKPGQENLAQALKLKEKKDKKYYLFLADNINTAEFENFGLPVYVNTACPGLSRDNEKIINLRSIKL